MEQEKKILKYKTIIHKFKFHYVQMEPVGPPNNSSKRPPFKFHYVQMERYGYDYGYDEDEYV